VFTAGATHSHSPAHPVNLKFSSTFLTLHYAPISSFRVNRAWSG
jgi:hypothetical protein